MLQSILAVTICAPDLAALETAYTNWLDYQVVERGSLPASCAQSWQAPALSGRPFLLLQPVSGEPVYLRFVETPSVAGYAPLRTFGWNATELLVQDPDALAERLATSPFKVIGPPRNLSSNDDIRAMQVLGPANELLYLTRLLPGAAGLNLGTANCPVDRPFIVVVGGPNLNALRDFYAVTLGLPVTPAMDVRISVLSNAHGLDPEQLHPLALAILPERFVIELDQYPPSATNRPQCANELPPGIALVSFTVAALDAVKADWLQGPQAQTAAPYNGRRCGVLRGVAGELIELVEGEL